MRRFFLTALFMLGLSTTVYSMTFYVQPLLQPAPEKPAITPLKLPAPKFSEKCKSYAEEKMHRFLKEREISRALAYSS